MQGALKEILHYVQDDKDDGWFDVPEVILDGRILLIIVQHLKELYNVIIWIRMVITIRYIYDAIS